MPPANPSRSFCCYHRGDVASQVKNPFFPVEQIVSRGYGAAGITLGQLSPDNAKSYRQGVIGFIDGERTFT